MAPIRKLLIANRAEIARRVIRSARDLGIRTVAVYSDADEDAPHVAEADEAVRLGPGPASSYLDLARLMEAVRLTGADALHPGYGFLSENGDLARACADAGITFVGPPEPAIRLMGDKVQAKRRMIAAGVPTAPGYIGEDQDEALLVAEGQRVGVPLLVKAVAGGGGRGMRVVRDLAELPAALASARAEAKNAFGRGDVFLERLVEGARHVEIQVFGDRHGHVIHLGERECSAQRRHQKVIEEAPSPAVTPELRERMGAAAVAAAQAIEYVGAGTVEFLLDADGERFYFLEMNTRLQVEHPVTELVTGLDLVAMQLRVAEGEPLPLTQADVQLRGHAIEARIYAEDPYAGFAPQLGRIAAWRPRTGAGLRVDDGVRTGQVISPYYDAMVAKLIAYGGTREEARRRLVAAVRDGVLLGPGSNRSFLLELLEGEPFTSGSITTDAIDKWLAQSPPPRPRPSPRAWAVAAVLRSRALTQPPEAPTDPWAWRSAGAPAWPVVLREHDETRTLRVRSEGRGRFAIEGPGIAGALVLRWVSHDDATVVVEHDGVRRKLAWAPTDDGVALDEEGRAFTFSEPPPRGAGDGDAEGGDGQVRAPIGGRVTAVLVSAGQAVTRGQPLVVLEAMKMEHRVPAPVDGTVARLSVKPDDQVAARQVLATIEASESKEQG